MAEVHDLFRFNYYFQRMASVSFLAISRRTQLMPTNDGREADEIGAISRVRVSWLDESFLFRNREGNYFFLESNETASTT